MDYTHDFGVPKRFQWLLNPKVHLRVGHQRTQFGLILVRFLDYYSPFWGPKANSIVVEPKGALTCRSSSLAVLADSVPFRDYYPVLGTRSGFTTDEPQGAFTCRLSTLTILANSGSFRALLLTVFGS